MIDNIKKTIVLATLVLTIITFPFNVSVGIYFGVLTNVLVNIFWTANLFCGKKLGKKKGQPPFGFGSHTEEKKIVARRPAL